MYALRHGQEELNIMVKVRRVPKECLKCAENQKLWVKYKQPWPRIKITS